MQTIDQDTWLEEINRAKGMLFYVYRQAEIWANAVEATIRNAKRKGILLPPSKVAEVVADRFFTSQTKVREEMARKHKNMPLPPPEPVRVKEVLLKHWANRELLAGWNRTLEGGKHEQE